MAMKLFNDNDIQDIADAIRSKNGSSDTYTVSEMASAIEKIRMGGSVTQDADGYIILPTEGGGSGMPLLDVITVSENSRAVNLDLTPYQTNDVVFIFSDVTLSAIDWLYYVKNGSAPSGGIYGSSAVHHYGMCFGLWLGSSDSSKYSSCPSGGSYSVTRGSVNNLYIYTYSASKTILAGSKFYVYGGTYADIL